MGSKQTGKCKLSWFKNPDPQTINSYHSEHAFYSFIISPLISVDSKNQTWLQFKIYQGLDVKNPISSSPNPNPEALKLQSHGWRLSIHKAPLCLYKLVPDWDIDLWLSDRKYCDHFYHQSSENLQSKIFYSNMLIPFDNLMKTGNRGEQKSLRTTSALSDKMASTKTNLLFLFIQNFSH